MSENKLLAIVVIGFMLAALILGVSRIVTDGQNSREAMRAGLEQVIDPSGSILWKKKEAK